MTRSTAPFRASFRRALTAMAASRWSVAVAAFVAPTCALVTTWIAARVPAEAWPRDIALRELQGVSAALHLVALTVAATLGATSTVTERAMLPRDVVTLSPLTGARRADANALAAWLLAAAVVAWMTPMLAAPFAFHELLTRSVVTIALSATLWAAVGAAVGVRVGATAPDASSAALRAVGLGTTVASLAWIVVGRTFGAVICAHFHVGDHGGAWWAEVLFDARLPLRTRAALGAIFAATPLLAANLALATGAARLGDDRDPAPLRTRWCIASCIALIACAAAPRYGGPLGGRTSAAIIATLAWGALQLVGVALALGPHHAPSRRALALAAGSRTPWLRRALAGGAPTAFALNIAWMFVGVLALAFVHGQLLGATPHRALAGTTRLVVIALFVPIAAVGLLTRTLATPQRTRTVLLVVVLAWAVVPSMCAAMLDAEAASTVASVAPTHILDALLHAAHTQRARPPAAGTLVTLCTLVTAATLPIAAIRARHLREDR